MTHYIKVRIEARARGRVAWVSVDNATKLNSLSSTVMAEFVETFQRLADDPDLRVAVLTGAGNKAFIGGANIDEMAELAGPEAARAFILKVHACCQAIRDLPVPVVAAVNGWCLGAGLEVAAACDLRLAAETAMFGMPEVKLGLPSVVEAALLPSLIGWGRTRQILMTGENFNAAQARAWGLVEDVHPDAALVGAVNDLVDSLLAAEPRAVRIQKALIQTWEDLPVREAIQAGVEAFEDAWTTEEPSLALSGFLAERRAAKADQAS